MSLLGTIKIPINEFKQLIRGHKITKVRRAPFAPTKLIVDLEGLEKSITVECSTYEEREKLCQELLRLKKASR